MPGRGAIRLSQSMMTGDNAARLYCVPAPGQNRNTSIMYVPAWRGSNWVSSRKLDLELTGPETRIGSSLPLFVKRIRI